MNTPFIPESVPFLLTFDCHIRTRLSNLKRKSEHFNNPQSIGYLSYESHFSELFSKICA